MKKQVNYNSDQLPTTGTRVTPYEGYGYQKTSLLVAEVACWVNRNSARKYN